jgi:hypothetical protein
MRRAVNNAFVVWDADVKKDILIEFSAYLPMQGARAWFIQSGLNKFIESVQYSPRLQRKVKDQVQDMISGGKEDRTGLMSISTRITQHSYNRFNDMFPEWGSTTWFVRRSVTSLVLYMREHNINLEELVEVSVSNTLINVQKAS